MSTRPSIQESARTKIVVTIGPATSDPVVMRQLVLAGADVMRLNMAHGTRDEHDKTVAAIRELERELEQPIAILVDLAGPKIRLGELHGGAVDCEAGKSLRFQRGATADQPDCLVTTYERLIDELNVGDRILLADATIEVIVEKVGKAHADCRVVQPGRVYSRQGIGLPGVVLSAPTLGPVDREAAVWATSREADFVSLSFVRSAADVADLRELLDQQESTAAVVAKVEKSEALDDLEGIVDAADVVMVARGDLGVEIDIAEVPLVQKRIVELCNLKRRPVIIATQILASMENSRHPTRAEVSDVANAVLDGGDACMLSGETAIGKYPVEAVEMMNRIARTTERQFRGRAAAHGVQPRTSEIHEITQAVVYGAARIATQLDARLLAVATRSGATALALSKQRLFTPVLGLSQHDQTLRKMCLYWGITPVRGAPVDRLPSLKEFVSRWGTADGCLTEGDPVVMVTGTGVAPGTHNAVEVHPV